MSFVRKDGSVVFLDRRTGRRDRVTPEQWMARRNALWLAAVEIGAYDPGSRRVRKYTVRELACLYGLTKQAVRNGIAAARSDREVMGKVFHD